MRSGTQLYQNIFTVKTFSIIGVISIGHHIVTLHVDQCLDNKVVLLQSPTHPKLNAFLSSFLFSWIHSGNLLNSKY